MSNAKNIFSCLPEDVLNDIDIAPVPSTPTEIFTTTITPVSMLRNLLDWSEENGENILHAKASQYVLLQIRRLVINNSDSYEMSEELHEKLSTWTKKPGVKKITQWISVLHHYEEYHGAKTKDPLVVEFVKTYGESSLQDMVYATYDILASAGIIQEGSSNQKANKRNWFRDTLGDDAVAVRNTLVSIAHSVLLMSLEMARPGISLSSTDANAPKNKKNRKTALNKHAWGVIMRQISDISSDGETWDSAYFPKKMKWIFERGNIPYSISIPSRDNLEIWLESAEKMPESAPLHSALSRLMSREALSFSLPIKFSHIKEKYPDVARSIARNALDIMYPQIQVDNKLLDKYVKLSEEELINDIENEDFSCALAHVMLLLNNWEPINWANSVNSIIQFSQSQDGSNNILHKIMIAKYTDMIKGHPLRKLIQKIYNHCEGTPLGDAFSWVKDL